jgi:hypothetical protein
MPRTPDRTPGVASEEGIVFDDDGIDPTVAGEVRFSGGAFKLQDAVGGFNPREVSAVPGAAGHVLISLDGTSFTSQCPLTGNGWLSNDGGELMVTG